MKLPKGIKRMRASASDKTLSDALDITGSGGFNGFIRTTAAKGVKEAGVIIFLDGRARIAVFQSPERSLYGPDALVEVKRISMDHGATIRVEEFMAQNLDEVQDIVAKMRKARVEAPDIERNLMGIDIETDPDLVPPKPPKAPPVSMEETQSESRRAKTTERIVRSKEAAEKDDEDILKMLERVGMSPTDEAEEMDDDVNQYIAAFEDFLTRPKDGGDAAEIAPVDVSIAVDEIIDEMLEAAGDDPEMMEFIEGQRERILSKVTDKISVSSVERRDRLSEQQAALEQISSTFRDALKASEAEAARRRSEGAGLRERGEAVGLGEERASSLETILGQVLDTHRERLEGADWDLEAEAEEIGAEKATEPQKELDLEEAKEGFLEEMRARIRTVSTNGEAEPMPGKVSAAVRSVSEDIHGRVEELEEEKETLTEDRRRLEDSTEDLRKRLDTMEVEMQVEVEARLKELEDREKDLRSRSEESKRLERHLEEQRKRVEEDLAKARGEHTRVAELEGQLKEREELLATREKDLAGKHEEVDGLKEHLEQEIAQRADELEALEERLRTREKELKEKEREITRAVDTVKRDREEGVEADLKRITGLEEELRKREEEYDATIKSMEAVIDALREELRINIEKVEGLEGQLGALHEAEDRVRELEEEMASAPRAGGGTDLEREDLRKLLAYLDDLLSKLPEQEIESFSKTEYFELYGRILDKLGI